MVLKESEVVIPMESMVDLEAERQRRRVEMEQLSSLISGLENRLNDKNFLTRAPTPVVEKERQKLYNLKDKLATVELPESVLQETTNRYIEIYEILTGKSFDALR